MNLYDKIKSPIETNENLLNLINIYASLKDAGQLNKMYTYITQDSEFDKSDTQLYEDKFFTYIVEPAAKKMEQQFKTGTYTRTNISFLHVYDIKGMKDMFNERSVENIIKKGREIENTYGNNVFKYIDSIFWHNPNEDRQVLYEEFLKQERYISRRR